MDEKSVPRTNRFNAVGFCLTGIRVWQWSSSFFAYASFGLLYDHIQRNHLGETNRMKAVQVLVCICSPYQHDVFLLPPYNYVPILTPRRAWSLSFIPPSPSLPCTYSRRWACGYGGPSPLYPSLATYASWAYASLKSPSSPIPVCLQTAMALPGILVSNDNLP